MVLSAQEKLSIHEQSLSYGYVKNWKLQKSTQKSLKFKRALKIKLYG